MNKHNRYAKRRITTSCMKYFLAFGLSLGAGSSQAQSPQWGFNYSNILQFSPPPTVSFAGAAMTSPFIPGIGPDRMNTNAHTVFDQSGQVLFTVTSKGIFDRTNNRITELFAAFPGGMKLGSEIEIFPNGKACGHYYVLYTVVGSDSDAPFYLLDVDASNPAYINIPYPDNPITLADNLGTSAYVHVPQYMSGGDPDGTSNGLVATAADRDGKRKVYLTTVTPDQKFVLRCWEFDAKGNYVELTPDTLDYGGTITGPLNPGDRMNRVTIMEATPDGAMIAYGGPHSLKVYNTITRTLSTYPIHDLEGDPHWSAITGIEWMPQLRRWYVSYTYKPLGSTKSVGTIKYFDEGVTSVINSLGGALLPEFGGSELELGKDNRMYFAACPTCPTVVGAGNEEYRVSYGYGTSSDPYANFGTLMSFDPVTSLLAPVYTPVSGIAVTNSTHQGNWYYLNNQIDGEDYSTWWSSGNIAGASVNNGASLSYTTPCSGSTPFGPLQLIDKSSDLQLSLRNAAGLAINPGTAEEYSISWTEMDACGLTPVSGSTFNYTDTWHRGSGTIDLKTYGNAVLGSTATLYKYFGITIKVRNTCNPGPESSYYAFIQVENAEAPCSKDFYFRMYPHANFAVELYPVNPTPNSTYKAIWNNSGLGGAGYSNINVSTLYTPGTYEVCVGEFRHELLKCEQCVSFCAPPNPGATPCLPFYIDGYSYVPGLYSIGLITPVAGRTYDYRWGDGGLGYVSANTHTYSAPGTYTICIRERDMFGNVLCETCTEICVPEAATAKATSDIQAGMKDEIAVYPNPAQDKASIRLALHEDDQVQITLSDISGKTIAQVFNGRLKTGTHEFDVATDQVAAGLYLLHVQTGERVRSLKLSVNK